MKIVKIIVIVFVLIIRVEPGKEIDLKKIPYAKDGVSTKFITNSVNLTAKFGRSDFEALTYMH